MRPIRPGETPAGSVAPSPGRTPAPIAPASTRSPPPRTRPHGCPWCGRSSSWQCPPYSCGRYPPGRHDGAVTSTRASWRACGRVFRPLAVIYNAEDRKYAAIAVKAFAKQYGAKFPKALKKIVDDEAALLAFYDFPAEHRIHLRTSNSIESTFVTVRLRTKVAKGAGSRSAALAMVFKLVESAQARWRAVNAPHLVALVRAGARFERGHLVGRSDAHAA
ncbi:transposase [Streptomyces sp. CB01635]|uniref:transposase n=1 Tax=Streptomyces sp. NPDC000188 TaxID=3154245 RepID=UPI002277EEED|nr:transposase [Streptomyces sp. CB01635]